MNLEPGIGQFGGEFFAVIGGDDAVIVAPQHQCWRPHPVQPLAQAGIVHIGAPAIERGGRAVAGDRGQFILAEGRVIGQGALRIEKGEAVPLVLGQGVDVGDVALLAPAKFDPERVDQHQSADPLDRAHAHFERDPPAEG